MEYSNLFVCLMGMGVVFGGLICLIFLTYGIGLLCNMRAKKAVSPQTGAKDTASASCSQELVAAISAVIAEETGISLSNIRISSLKTI
ncbi:OadG family protein [uncultured Dysosmobacter sp.]|uniref:OadG family protein n=1 Tax=uncultured Dysosmobacter sp. TaxID=2591384 RepID=UPI00262E4D3C|nr:OadG family protein [uncultured Dysosmobacter sp.]